jgi:NRAMP (natural resistance-associated macrophage protein)-like metal ion transporter
LNKKKKNIKQRILNVLFWSVISAAFIGPGTVTTMTKAGIFFHYDLMWTIVFSIIACFVLQEASARLAILSGLNLGQAIAKHYESKSSKYLIFTLIIGAIILGSAAYETGNILGSVEGLAFILKKVPKQYFVLGIGILAFFSFRMKSIRTIAQILGAFVYLMGLAFILTAIFVHPEVSKIMHGIFIPTIPNVPGAGILILGIIGTTVVPYDLFLGSGIVDKTQTIREARLGLAIAIILGGLISMSIMTVGSSISQGMSPESIQHLNFNFKLMKSGLYLNSYINDYAVYIFGFGMFAAGFTSAITAPLASAITAQNIFNSKSKKWQAKGLYFQAIAVGILLVGFILGMIQIKPVPAIIMAQAFNGLILPFISIFMIIIINNPEVMKENINSHFSNIILSFVVWITLLIGTFNILKALQKTFSINISNQDILFWIAAILNLFVTGYILYKIYKKRAQYKENSSTNL